MICITCRKAGSYNQIASQIDDAGQDDDRAATLRRIARSIHSTCADINCPCQHQAGHWLSATAARQLQLLMLASGAAAENRELYGYDPRNLFTGGDDA